MGDPANKTESPDHFLPQDFKNLSSIGAKALAAAVFWLAKVQAGGFHDGDPSDAEQSSKPLVRSYYVVFTCS